MTLADLVASWRTEAQRLEAWGATGHAATLRHAADELEQTLQTEADELLNLEQAAELSGFSSDHLGREVRLARIPNRGRPHAPRIRRGDLPVKPGHLPPEPVPSHLVGARGRIARAVANSTLGE